MPKILRITTVPISLNLLLTGQMSFMSKNGFEVVMVSADGKEIDEVKNRESCPHYIIPFTRKISPIQDLNCLWQLLKLIRKEKPDIIHTHTPKAGLLGMLAGRLTGVKLKMHTIAGLPLMTATGLKKGLLIFIEKLTYWAADIILPNSQSIMSYVKTNKFTTDKKLHMIGGGSSNGIDLQRFSKKSIDLNKLELLKEAIQFRSENKYILAVGRVVKDKGIAELVEAFVQTKKIYPELNLIIVGPLEEERIEESLPKDISFELKNNVDIIHINWSEEVEYYMAIADLLVHASYREGFPNVVLQAGAMECPIVCSNIPGNIDIVRDDITGQQFEVKNKEHLIQKIKFVFENESIVKGYAVHLRSEIESNYSRKFIHQELLNYYLEKLK